MATTKTRQHIQLVVVLALALFAARASAAAADPGPGRGPEPTPGRGRETACTAHLTNRGGNGRALTQQGCVLPPTCAASNTCDALPPLSETASCANVPGTCVIVTSATYSLWPGHSKTFTINCPAAQPYWWDFASTTSSSWLTVVYFPNPFTSTAQLSVTGTNWSPISINSFSASIACSNQAPPSPPPPL